MLSVDLETLGMLSVDLDTLSMPSVDLDELSMLSVDLDELSMLSVDLDTGHAQCGPGRTEHAQFVRSTLSMLSSSRSTLSMLSVQPSMGVLQTGQQTAPRLMPFPSGSIRFRLVPSGSDLPLSRQRLFLPDSAVARPLTLAVKTFLFPWLLPLLLPALPGGSESRQDRLDSIAVAGAVMGAVLASFLITVFTIVIVAPARLRRPASPTKCCSPRWQPRPPPHRQGSALAHLSAQQWGVSIRVDDRVLITHRELTTAEAHARYQYRRSIKCETRPNPGRPHISCIA
ncbi:unnamed protein product [Arctogadus glacialis]